MHPEAERLATQFVKDFWAADHTIRWHALEMEHMLWIAHNTVVVGKIDAVGETEGGVQFFGDWKTGSKNKARNMDSEKAKWRMDPQALTYGVLMGGDQVRGQAPRPYTNSSEINCLLAPMNHFTVRWALKTEPATTDFEWYHYSQAELDWWTDELLEIADQIRRMRFKYLERTSQMARSANHWPTNLLHCTRYGDKYPCTFRDQGCHKLNFDFIPESMVGRDGSHLDIEDRIKAGKIVDGQDIPVRPDSDLVVLDASRVGDWLGCHELYRRLWEPWLDKAEQKEYDGLSEVNEALTIGTDFHSLIAAHLRSIQEVQTRRVN